MLEKDSWLWNNIHGVWKVSLSLWKLEWEEDFLCESESEKKRIMHFEGNPPLTNFQMNSNTTTASRVHLLPRHIHSNLGYEWINNGLTFFVIKINNWVSANDSVLYIWDFYLTPFGGRVYKWKFCPFICPFVCLSVITSYLTDQSLTWEKFPHFPVFLGGSVPNQS